MNIDTRKLSPESVDELKRFQDVINQSVAESLMDSYSDSKFRMGKGKKLYLTCNSLGCGYPAHYNDEDQISHLTTGECPVCGGNNFSTRKTPLSSMYISDKHNWNKEDARKLAPIGVIRWKNDKTIWLDRITGMLRKGEETEWVKPIVGGTYDNPAKDYLYISRDAKRKLEKRYDTDTVEVVLNHNIYSQSEETRFMERTIAIDEDLHKYVPHKVKDIENSRTEYDYATEIAARFLSVVLNAELNDFEKLDNKYDSPIVKYTRGDIELNPRLWLQQVMLILNLPQSAKPGIRGAIHLEELGKLLEKKCQGFNLKNDPSNPIVPNEYSDLYTRARKVNCWMTSPQFRFISDGNFYTYNREYDRDSNGNLTFD